MATETRQLRQDIVDAIESEEGLSQEQLRELIRFEAEELGLSFVEAVERGRRRALPKVPLGMDIENLVRWLDE